MEGDIDILFQLVARYKSCDQFETYNWRWPTLTDFNIYNLLKAKSSNTMTDEGHWTCHQRTGVRVRVHGTIMIIQSLDLVHKYILFIKYI